jgi:hypothetical protein
LYELSIVLIEDTNPVEVRDLFKRLQDGVTLNPQERRNAMLGDMRDFIAELAKDHVVFPRTNISNKRYEHDDVAAVCMALEIAKGPAEVKANELTQMYTTHAQFNENGQIAKRINKVLNYLSRVLEDQPPEMSIKWGFVDLYLLVSNLIGSYKITKRENDLTQFFIGFENERRTAPDFSELNPDKVTVWDTELYAYIDAFKSGAGTRTNVTLRSNIYLRKFLQNFPDLIPKDNRRDFSDNQRIIIWREAAGKCKICSKEITIDEMHADHIIAHNNGGKTTVENGHVLCGPCNLSKSSS